MSWILKNYDLNMVVTIWSTVVLTIGTILICTGPRRRMAVGPLPIALLVAAFETYSQSQHGNWTLLFWLLTSPVICPYLLILALVEWRTRVRSSEQQPVKVGIKFVLVVLALVYANLVLLSWVFTMFTGIHIPFFPLP